MTLDELIEALLDFRAQYPAAGGALVIGLGEAAPLYDRGYVFLEEDEDDHDDM
jgi:hypothetical protein